MLSISSHSYYFDFLNTFLSNFVYEIAYKLEIL